MPRSRRLLGLALLVAGPAFAQSTRPVTWLAIDYPPYTILQGKQKGQGIADAVTHLLQAHLPQWTHRDEVADPVAIMARMRAGDRVCSVPYIKTPEREQVFTFSVPALIAPPLGVTIRRDELARFGGGKPVSLDRLLGDSHLKLAIAVGRSYGPALDAVLARHKDSPHVYRRQGVDVYRGLFDMVLKGNVDYVLGLPQEALYVAREQGVEERIVNLPLSESSEYVLGYVVCPKTDWGRQAIAAIDRVLVAERPTHAYQQSLERWVDATTLDEFRRQYAAKLAHAN